MFAAGHPLLLIAIYIYISYQHGYTVYCHMIKFDAACLLMIYTILVSECERAYLCFYLSV